MNLDELRISPDATLRGALERMTASKSGIVLVVTPDARLYGIVTEGDVRRAIVAGRGLETTVAEIATRDPITASPDASPDDLVHLLQATRKQSVPIVDEDGRVVGIEFLSDLLRPDVADNYVVLMAGGYGKRLRPYTERVPKPMLRIDGKPLLEIIVERLVQQGLNRMVMLLHYLPEVIEQHFGGRAFAGREIEFVTETEPLGTAGGLGLVRDRLTEPFLVMNGDTLIRANWRNMLRAHGEQGNQITIGATDYGVQIPYGVLEAEDGRVVAITEKPHKRWLTVCSAYCISPEVLELLEPGVVLDMPALIAQVLERGGRVGYFHVTDVTRIEDLVPAHSSAWAEQSVIPSEPSSVISSERSESRDLADETARPPVHSNALEAE